MPFEYLAHRFFSARQELRPTERQEVVKEEQPSPSCILKPSLYTCFSATSLLYAMFSFTVTFSSPLSHLANSSLRPYYSRTITNKRRHGMANRHGRDERNDRRTRQINHWTCIAQYSFLRFDASVVDLRETDSETSQVVNHLVFFFF